MATYWENSCSFGLRYVSWYKYLIVSLVFSHLGFWSGNLFLIAPFPDLCLLVPFFHYKSKTRTHRLSKLPDDGDPWAPNSLLTPEHFLLDCQNYHQIRNRTLSDFLHLPTKSLLFGDPRLTEEENTNIFEAVHKFITQTGRFDN